MAQWLTDTDAGVTLGRVLRVSAEVSRGGVLRRRGRMNCGWRGCQVILVEAVLGQEDVLVGGPAIVVRDRGVGVLFRVSFLYLRIN